MSNCTSETSSSVQTRPFRAHVSLHLFLNSPIKLSQKNEAGNQRCRSAVINTKYRRNQSRAVSVGNFKNNWQKGMDEEIRKSHYRQMADVF
jgi:hypothetical protein